MMLLRTLEIPLNLTTRLPLTARTAWTFVQAPRLVRGVATGSEESVEIVQATTSGWVAARLGLPGAKVR